MNNSALQLFQYHIGHILIQSIASALMSVRKYSTWN